MSIIRWYHIVGAILCHTIIGCYPTFARYMQTQSLIPTFIVLFMCNLVSFSFNPFAEMLYRKYNINNQEKKNSNESYTILLFIKKIFSSKSTFIHAFIFSLNVTIRSFTNIISTRFAKSVFVQLGMLTVPFWVVILNYLLPFGNKQIIPCYTYLALIFSAAGSVFVLIGGYLYSNSLYSPTTDDFIGFGLSITSAFFLGLYFIIVKNMPSDIFTFSKIIYLQMFTIGTLSLVTSFILQEDWTNLLHLSPVEWIIFSILIFIIYFFGNSLQITLIQLLGSSLVSTVLPLRLIVSLIVGIILLNEYFNFIQILSSIFVTFVLFLYLFYSYKSTIKLEINESKDFIQKSNNESDTKTNNTNNFELQSVVSET